jgi:hypothetical protein
MIHIWSEKFQPTAFDVLCGLLALGSPRVLVSCCNSTVTLSAIH